MKFSFVYFLGILLLSTLIVNAEEDDFDDDDSEGNDDDDDGVLDLGDISPPNGDDDDGGVTETIGSLPFDEEEEVMVLNKDNFESALLQFTPLLVEFYAPWCGHCQKLAPEYTIASKQLKEDDNPAFLAKVDATVEKALAEKYGITGYPTLKLFHDGDVYDYDGPRDADGIVQYMREKADPNYVPPETAVVPLVENNFSEFVDEHELSLVEFYAPWCGHCKKLAPEYEKAAKTLKKEDPPIALAKVDATEEPGLAKKFDVTGYPTLKVFRKGKVFDYDGGRDSYDKSKMDRTTIIDYMKMQSGDASKVVDNLKELKKGMENDDITVVGFFDSEDDIYQKYQTAVNDFRGHITLLHTFDKEAREFYKVNTGSIVVFNAEKFYTKFEPKWHVLEIKDSTSEVEIRDHVNNHEVPLVGHYSQATKDKRYGRKRPLVIIFYTVDFGFDNIKATQIWRNKIASIANSMKKKYPDMTFAVADDEKESKLFNSFGFDESGEDINIGILGDKDRKYPMEPMDEFDEDEIMEFMDKFKKGKVAAKIKSQPVPKKQKGPVAVVVGKNFEDIVFDKTKDVLIEFYAPWCGHCKKLEPIYKDLAKKYKKEKNLVVAKIDATANDFSPIYEASGFPTIYYAPANNKDNPIKYEGDRTVAGFEEFLKEKATVTFGKSLKDEL